MKVSAGKVIGIGIIVLCLTCSGFLFKKAMINYVSFHEASQATDSTVQIMGAPVAGTMHYDELAHMLRFSLTDNTGDTMAVEYKGPKPDDLDSAAAKATKITVQGTYDPGESAFVADKLLVKCPSKYQGKPDTTRTYGS
jgi:cytochrome c-type biogenesis protein CcmE